MAASETQAGDFGESLLSRRIRQRTDFPPMTAEITKETTEETTGTQHFVDKPHWFFTPRTSFAPVCRLFLRCVDVMHGSIGAW